MDIIAGKDRTSSLAEGDLGAVAAVPGEPAGGAAYRVAEPAAACVGRREARGRLDQLYEPIRDQLEGCERILRAELRNENAYVDQLVRHGFRLGGKRLRPALLLLAARAAGNVTDEHLVLAAVVEMIHTATLVHDDVLDGATVRRHLHTLNSRWGNEASVLVGDYLFTHSFYLASTLSDTFACRTIGRATNLVCEGELRQIESRGNFDLGQDEYLAIIEAKTAELCACSCLLGAHYAVTGVQQGRAVEEALARYGRWLGIAFQITDDLLDLVGHEAATGKSMGTDLALQKPTLPIIRLLEQAGPRRHEVVELLAGNSSRPEALQAWFQRTDALAYTREKAAEFARKASDELRLLPASPAREVLLQLAGFVVDRRQ
ncbi:MAG: polyprenyl synthetase family protein [Pirellulales bacterium]